MMPRFEAMLIAAYPILNPYRYPNTSYYYDRFSCCPNGWARLIAEFAHKVSQCNPDRFVLYDIKEKYRHLYLYADCEETLTDVLDTLVDEIEKKSAITCGVCGNPLSPHPHRCHGRISCSKALEQWLGTYLEVNQ